MTAPHHFSRTRKDKMLASYRSLSY